ncbi:MAG: NAD(P)H-dependent oxidoreductase [Rhizobiaceae bacterium]|nr:NAD(P)H-dependent oxidoreductase [Rhizobiaceae bacterium]
MSKPKIAIVVGSTRPGRFADHPAQWIMDRAKAKGDFDLELVDLRDFNLPLFDESMSPAYGPVESEAAKVWQDKVAEFDGFIFTAAEYNRGPTGVLKNALDYAYQQWNGKTAAFVGYGGVGGARAIEQLRLNAIELQMAPIRNAVHIMFPVYMDVVKNGKKLSDFDFLNEGADGMLDQLAWWTSALKTAREADTATAKAA